MFTKSASADRPMFKMRGFVILAALALAPSAKATTLTFDGPICGGPCADGSHIDPHYGSTPFLAVSYVRDVLGGVNGNALSWYNTGYSDLKGIGYGGFVSTEGEPAIVLTPLHGATITLEGFDLGAWEGYRPTQVSIFDGSTQVYYSGPISISDINAQHFVAGFSSTSPIQIAWGPDGYDVGIDNISFTVTAPPIGVNGAVPEASTWAMMLAGLGALGLAWRRRAGRMTLSVID